MKIVYVPFPDAECADAVAEEVIANNLAACVNTLPSTSRYPWDGDLQEEDEVVALFKTTVEQIDALRTALEKQHPYDVPCIATLDAVVNDAYGDWVREQTGGTL